MGGVGQKNEQDTEALLQPGFESTVTCTTDFVATTSPPECCSAPRISRRADTRFDERADVQKSLDQDTISLKKCDLLLIRR
jgi:hypothetical protein